MSSSGISLRWKITIACVGCLAVVLACSRLIPSEDPPLSVEHLALHPRDYVSVAWFEDWIVLETSSLDGNWNIYTSRLWKAKPDGSDFEMLNLPKPSDCGANAVSGFKEPIRLPDNRLGFVVRCGSKNDPPHESHSFMMAYDLTTEKLEQLPAYEFPTFGILRTSSSWNPEMTQGIAYADNRLESWAVKFSLAAWEPLDLGFPQIRGFAWSPDGLQIALIAAPEQGLDGMNRSYAKFNLYLLNPEKTEIHPILMNLYDPYDLIWSPDSQWLAFFATINSKTGLWLLNMATDELKFAGKEDIGPIAWSPEGKKIIHIRSTEDMNTSEIVTIDVSPLLRQ